MEVTLPPGKGSRSTHWLGGWVGSKARLDTEARRTFICPIRDRIPAFQSVANHYTTELSWLQNVYSVLLK
jgi:hypothetical protein